MGVSLADLGVLRPAQDLLLASGDGVPADAECDVHFTEQSGRVGCSSVRVTFDLASDRNGDPGAGTSAQHEDFQRDFRRDLDRLDKWSRENRWPPRIVSELKVSVSAEYRISKSLVPAWHGETGHMQFPLWRVAARKAAIAHELVHVFFPNGNRFLAEGLAVYLQAAIGGNQAFPNFARPLHELARELIQRMTPASARGHTTCSDRVRLSELDAIATPSPLELRVGQDFYGEDARGQAHIYPLAGSFVQFLIASRGLAAFRELYAHTPLVPLHLERGAPGRWNDVYGLSLADLEAEWSSSLGERAEAESASQSNLSN